MSYEIVKTLPYQFPAPVTIDSVVDVLDQGYVRYVKHMGDDLDVVNSAKVSFDKESATFEEKEARLLAFLAREEHTSTFRHSALTYEVYAPLMVARQWWKYAVASSHLEDQNGWNESSRRYVTEEPTFYIPDVDEWRSQPDNKKQGSGEPLRSLENKSYYHRKWADSGDFNETEYGNYWTERLEAYCDMGEKLYRQALVSGVCAEQARLFLPAYGMYVRWRWTASLGAVMHFLFQRLGHEAQREIYDYAVAVKDITAEHFPESMKLVSGGAE